MIKRVNDSIWLHADVAAVVVNWQVWLISILLVLHLLLRSHLFYLRLTVWVRIILVLLYLQKHIMMIASQCQYLVRFSKTSIPSLLYSILPGYFIEFISFNFLFIEKEIAHESKQIVDIFGLLLQLAQFVLADLFDFLHCLYGVQYLVMIKIVLY